MCFAMFLQVLACQNGHQTPKKHANMLGFFQVSLTITKKTISQSFRPMAIFGIQNQTAKLYKIGLNDE